MNAALPSATKRYTLNEIADAKGVSRQALSKRANKENWPDEKIACSGGHQRYFALTDLPKDLQKALTDKAINAVLPVIAQEVAAPIVVAATNQPEALLTDKQRFERDARLGVRKAIERTMVEGRCSQAAAMNTLLIAARMGSLDPFTANMLRLARDPRGACGDGFPSVRTLKRWLAATNLAPVLPQKNMIPPPWAQDFMALWQVPQKPSVNQAYQEFRLSWPYVSIHQVRRFIEKMGAVSRERGRMGPRELKNIKPFIRRDFSHLEPNEVWTADGHTFDAEVQHPATGKPFRPEITAILDVATRACVGWSVGLAESSFAVLDALRSAVDRHGVPGIFYVDNGAGYKNQLMSKEGTGLLGRIGTTVKHSLPYNSQAKGVIERSHQSIWISGAKMLPSYIGASMDREAKLAHFKITRKAARDGGAMPVIPWHLFIEFCGQIVEGYNNRPHRSLKGVSPSLCWRAFESRGFNAVRVSAEAMETLFRPQIARVTQRGEILLFNNRYFSKDLEEFHGETVFVGYDIHDASRVWIHNEDGQLICTAEVNGNRRAYFPQSVIEQAKDKRLEAQIKRIDAKRNTAIEERTGAPAIVAPASASLVIGGNVIDINALSSKAELVETQQIPAIDAEIDETESVAVEVVKTAAPATPAAPAVPRSERSAQDNYAEWLEVGRRLTAGEPVCEADAFWHQSYQRTAQFRAMQKKTAAV